LSNGPVEKKIPQTVIFPKPLSQKVHGILTVLVSIPSGHERQVEGRAFYDRNGHFTEGKHIVIDRHYE